MFCGACNGMGFAPPTGGVSLRTGPRNFIGRCGNESALVHLTSPEVAAASALAGKIADLRDLGIPAAIYRMPEQFVIDDTLFTLPDERPSSAPVRRGPNIPPLPEIEPVPAVLEGPAVIKVGNNITTDHIVPAG